MMTDIPLDDEKAQLLSQSIGTTLQGADRLMLDVSQQFGQADSESIVSDDIQMLNDMMNSFKAIQDEGKELLETISSGKMLDDKQLCSFDQKAFSVSDTATEMIDTLAGKPGGEALDTKKISAGADKVKTDVTKNIVVSGMLDQSFDAVMSQEGVSEDLKDRAIGVAKTEEFQEVAAGVLDVAAPGLGTALKLAGSLAQAAGLMPKIDSKAQPKSMSFDQMAEQANKAKPKLSPF